MEKFEQLNAQVQNILEVHREHFPPIERPTVPPPEHVKDDHFIRERKRAARKEVPFWHLQERREAMARAVMMTLEDSARERERREMEGRTRQEILDEDWEALLANKQEAVIASIDAAFEDNEAPAAPVNVEGERVSIVMLAPSLEEIPDQKPALTPTGRPTLKKMTKTERSAFYLALICGHALATVREALATAPGIREATIVAVRKEPPDVFGEERTAALLAGTYHRETLERVNWPEADAPSIVEQAASRVLMNLKGQTRTMEPIDLSNEPELAALVAKLTRLL